MSIELHPRLTKVSAVEHASSFRAFFASGVALAANVAILSLSSVLHKIYFGFCLLFTFQKVGWVRNDSNVSAKRMAHDFEDLILDS